MKYSILGWFTVICTASFKKRDGFFERPFTTENCGKIGRIVIVNDKRGKKAFLKKRPCEAIFPASIADDEVLGGFTAPIAGGARDIMIPHTGMLLLEAVRFAKKKLPLDEIAIFAELDEAEKILSELSDMTRMITIVGEDGEGAALRGVFVRRVKRLTKSPSAAVFMSRAVPIPGVPAADLRDEPEAGALVVSKNNVTFKKPDFLSSLSDEDISADTAAYFIGKGFAFTPEIYRTRKKSPELFTLG